METFLVWLATGIVAGWLASAVLGGGYGPLGDVVVGIIGAFLGGFVFRAFHLRAPFHGLGSTIFVAFAGAILLLLVLRLLRPGSPRFR